MDGLPLNEMTPKFHIARYNPACVIFFSITGLVLQVPVIYVHCGIFSRPNIPVIIMALSYVYMCISITLTAFGFNSDDPSHYWSGKGWCDVDVRMQISLCLCILSTQCVINWNLLGMLNDRPRLARGRQAYTRAAIELLACLFLPIVSMAISTFFMRSRFEIIQDMGCLSNTDTSVALIIVYAMWLPILGIIALVTMIIIMYNFYKRGKDKTFRTISFIPNMSVSQFIRIIVFSLVVTCIFVPLCIALAVINFVSIGEIGGSALAWLHGKPATCEDINVFTLQEVEIAANGVTKASVIVNFITRYINIVIAWLLFLCYGTGALALEAYKKTYHIILSWFGREIISDDDQSTTYSFESQSKSPIIMFKGNSSPLTLQESSPEMV